METTLGAQLKSIRESRGISLEEIAHKTHIRLAYLKALESGETDQLTSQTQRRGFLRLYANELGVTIEGDTIAEFQPISSQPVEPITPQEISDVPPPEMDGQKTSHTKNKNAVSKTPSDDQENIETKQEEPIHPTGPSEPATSAKAFSELGNTLKQRRELLSLSIESAHTHTHIQKRFLTAMEQGDFNQLPSHVQAQGMLTNYADFLNLDIDEVLLQYADGLQLRRLERSDIPRQNHSSQAKSLSTTRLKLKNFFSLDLLVIAAFFIGFSAFVFWGINRILSADNPDVASTDLPEVAEVLLATGSPTPQETLSLDEENTEPDQTSTPVLEEPTPLFTPLPNNNPINLVIIPNQRVWVRVIADGEPAFEGRMLPGNAYDFSGEEQVEILTGSAGAIQIFFNDENLGAPGLVGQVVNLIFTEQGQILPTPTSTPTATETPQVTLTPTPTPSQTPEPTTTPPDAND